MRLLFFFSCLFFLSSFFSFSQLAPETDPHRGLYFDRFIKIKSNGSVDTSLSYLGIDNNSDGIFEREDSVLKYCSENHITYLAMYDMHRILGQNRFLWNENTKQYEKLEKHLCRFIEKAKNQYCITQIGCIGGGTNTFDSLLTFMDRYPVTPVYRLRPDQINNPFFSDTFYIVEKQFPLGSAEQQFAEQLKLILRVSDFNCCNECQAAFDVINLEEEFWFSCTANWPGYMNKAIYMDSITNMFNSTHPLTPLATEFYLGTLFYCSGPYTSLSVAEGLDGCSNCSPCPSCSNPHPKVADRILLSYLAGDPAFFNHTYAYQFNNALTTDSTDFHPLLYSEGYVNGGFTNYLGDWFAAWYGNTIFMSEMYFLNSYWNNPSSAAGTPTQNDVQPGGFMWFAQSYQVGWEEHPLIFYSASPYCDSLPVQIALTYTGPMEGFTEYHFSISRNSDSVFVYPEVTGITNAYYPAHNGNPQIKTINFSDTSVFPSMVLNPGDYTAHLLLKYNSGNGCSYQYDQAITISNRPSIIALGDTIFCEGNRCWLKASSAATYQWYRNGKIIPGATSQIYKVLKDGDYTCRTGSGTNGCEGISNGIHIHVRPAPLSSINAHCTSATVMTLIANVTDTLQSANNYGPGGLTYQWSTGATTDRINVSYTGSRYTLITTDPYSGCSRYSSIIVPAALDSSTTFSITVNATPSNCSANGTLAMVSNTSYPVAYQWNNGVTTAVNANVYAGDYSVVATIWNSGCSYFRSVSTGTASSIQASATITPVSCKGKNDGAINLLVTGGTPPYEFQWFEIPDECGFDPFTKDQNSLYPGLYTVEVTDSLGCQKRFSFRVNVISQNLAANVSSVSPVTNCATNANGSATMSATGGNNPYSYAWNDTQLQTGQTATNLAGGTYQVTVTDNNGCTATKSVHIPSVPEINFSLAEDSSNTYLNCYGDSTGRLVICLQGGTLPYQSSSGVFIDSSKIELPNLPAGNFSVQITDANGCMVNSPVYTVTQPLPLLFTSTTFNASCQNCADGRIELSISGGISPYQIISGTGIVNGTTIENLVPGMHTICVTDSNQCMYCETDTIGFYTGLPILNNSDLKIILAPNPSSGSTNIYSSGGTKIISADIFDATGKRVGHSAFISREVKLENYEPGIYFIRLLLKGNVYGYYNVKWIVTRE